MTGFLTDLTNSLKLSVFRIFIQQTFALIRIRPDLPVSWTILSMLLNHGNNVVTPSLLQPSILQQLVNKVDNGKILLQIHGNQVKDQT